MAFHSGSSKQEFPALVLPGQPLCVFKSQSTTQSESKSEDSSSSPSYIPGPGTHIHNNHITASIVGRPVVTPAPESSNENITSALYGSANSGAEGKKMQKGRHVEALSVVATAVDAAGEKWSFEGVRSQQAALPSVGATVIGRVRRIERLKASVEILAVDGVAVSVGGEFTGTIRMQDVRATEIDKVKLFEAFRVGDVVRAEVNSLGDQSSYYITTARNELGVVMATSEAGNAMYPISWKEFCDPVTGATETRKVAKPS